MSDSFIHSVAGATGGIVAMTATYPLIFLSTRAAVKIQSENKTTYEAVLEIIEREGVSGLYSGLNSSLLAIAVTNGVYYYFYERTRGLVLKSRVGSKGLSTLESMLTGLIAGSATAILSNPLWVIQTTQAVQTMESQSQRVVKKLGFLQAIKNILAKSGAQGFWRGIGPALVLTVNPIIQYTVFEQLKNLLVTKRMARLRAAGTVASAAIVLSDFDFFVLGAISKLVATLTTYPYIVVKSRLQAGSTRYKSSIDGLGTIVREEGVQGLWKGAGSKLTQSVFTAAILFAAQRRIYQVTKSALTVAAK
ncbi:mitochondrial carrier [Marasmius fiardii PR-910]|nr:mitochondrial carrier [Marasmius fiardii PR-910]